MAAKKAPAKKMAAPAKKTSSSEKDIDKAREDARKRASKYGTPVGTTRVESSKPFKDYPNDTYIMAYTNVKSARGNMYEVRETKSQRKMLPDTSPWITTKPIGPTRKARDPKFGPTPAKKTAPKKKK